MPTKFPRRVCATCSRKLVSWKMPSIANETGTKRIFICWDCARLFYEKLVILEIWAAPIKEKVLKGAFKIPKKRKQETF